MRKKSSKKGRRSRYKEEVTYAIEIRDYDFSYSFSVNWLRDRDTIEGPYWEHTDLEIKSKIIYPDRLTDKEIKITIMGNRSETRVLNKPEDYHNFEPKAVGTMTIRGKQSELLCWVPFDAFQMLCSMLNTGKIKYLMLHGQALYRGAADIRSVSFQEHFGPEDIG
ncbi:MAG: hypothetical protein ABIB41_09050 [Nitrospirota bacterium]